MTLIGNPISEQIRSISVKLKGLLEDIAIAIPSKVHKNFYWI